MRHHLVFVRYCEKKMLSSKMSGSSMIETIVAMVIVMMVFSIASIIYLNVYRSGMRSKNLDAVIRIQEVWAETKLKVDFNDKEWEAEDFTVYREVLPHPGNDRLLIVRFEARDVQRRPLAERKFLIYKSD